jgi:glycosyltransferase involved in cell wall biosynthesis
MSIAQDPDIAVTVERFGPEVVAPGVVIAIPVKDEEERLPGCLQSLATQENVDFADVAVVLLLNNCTDGTAEVVRALAPSLPFATHMLEATLTGGQANAGWARKLAMDAAARLAAPDGVLLTTDADTLVHPDWIEANLREIKAGHDAVAGYVMAEPNELMELPAAILERGRLEWEYQQLAAELDARVDVEAHDPWPRHNQNCGASAAVTLRAYRLIGGLPPRPVGEDRALFEMIRRIDGKIRHSLEVQVVTSARTDGRASGGLADEIRLRTDPDHPCDEALEVAIATLRRAQWRFELRQAWEAGRIEAVADVWTKKLHIPSAAFRTAAHRRHFGAFWAELEALSPKLVRRLVTPAELKREHRRIRRLVDIARQRARAKARAEREAARRRVA